MAKTIADLVVESLKDAGVKRVYGLPGDSLNGFTDALRRDGTLEWVHVRNEEVAAFAAGADAHLTGDLAVCAASCGPGNLHLINGLFDCHRSNPCTPRNRRGRLRCRLSTCVQCELKRAARPRIASGPNAAAVLFDNRPADRQPHAHTVLLRREEGAEQPVRVLG